MHTGNLREIQQDLAAISEKLDLVFKQASEQEQNQFFEGIGAAQYYLNESHWKIEWVIEQIEAMQHQSDSTR